MTKSYFGLQLTKPKSILQGDKSLTPATSHGSSLNRPGRNLKTPIRRFFKLEALRSRSRTRKPNPSYDRDVAYGQDLDLPEATPPPLSDPATSTTTLCDTPNEYQDFKDTPSPQQLPAAPCVALQNPDPTVDAVVVSTLLTLPFCCHEDLLTMPPTRVIEVAQEVNERLPEALRVDLREPRDPNKVRRELENLVGIVKRSNEVQVPGAPLKRVNGRGPQDPWKFFGKDVFQDQELSTISPPTSPLAAVSAIRRKGRKWEADVPMILRPTKLDILEEDDEDDIMEVEEEDSKDATRDEDEEFFRMTKKRRISNSPEDIEMTTPVVHHVEVPLVFKKLFEDVNTSPSPRRSLRAHTQPTVTPDGVFAPPAATNRPLAKPFATDRSFVNTRARYCSSNKISRTQKTTQLGRGQGPFQAPTPKANQRRYHSGSFEKYAIFALLFIENLPRSFSSEGL